MDMTAIGGAVASLRAAGDIAKGLISLHTMTEVQTVAVQLNEKIIDAQHRIFEANAAQSALVDRIRELESEIARIKAWDAEKQRYKLVAPVTGSVVYALQRSMSSGEPPHYLCANCFKQGKPSPLSDMRREKGTISHYLTCPNCDYKAPTGYNGPMRPQYAEDIHPSQ
jgi:DNA-directed RNA polymerase subunit RPC12/RpoP